MKDGRKWLRLLVACMLAGSLVLAGCSGDDGDPGPAGPPGIDGTSGIDGTDGVDGTDGTDGVDGVDGVDGNPGTPGQDGATVLLNAHDIAQRGATVTVATVTPTATGAVITANVKVDGVDRNDFGTVVAVASYTTTTNAALPPGKIGSYDYGSGTGTVVSNGSGNYTITVAPPETWVSNGWWTPGEETTWMVRLNTGTGINYPEANIVANATADGQHLRQMVSNQACVNCHDTNIFKEQHASRVYHNSSYASQSCVTCHTSSSRKNLMAYAHGIHNAHNMAERSITSGTVTVTKPAGVYARNNSTTDSPTTWYRTTYPTYMTNCSVCHDSTESLAAANNAAVSYDLCMSCHDSWAGFGDSTFGNLTHTGMTATTNCASCHDGSIAPNKVADFHNGLLTERSGLIWDGADVSVTEGAKINMQFTGITRIPAVAPATVDSLAITWTATQNGAEVNPCNTTVSATAPTWQSGFSILRAYGEGDDWTNAGIGTSPGQPVSTNLSFTAVAPAVPNTVCAGNVATTTIALTAAEQALPATARGIVALQGKPQITFTPAAQTISVRAKTPTREFVVGTGAAPATARRDIVDTASCLKCHVGSLYQHGGNRIDNVDMCVMCHNEASSEQNVRVGDGVAASEAYDGQAGQTYGFKSLLHAVHSAGVNGAITMVYRTMGIFVWTGEDTVIPNWPGTGPQTVYGSNPLGTNLVGTTRVHNLHVPTYPQNLKNCQACHKPGTEELPDQSQAVATTVNAGGTTWANQLDDTLQGPAAAACTSCHQSPVFSVQAGMQAHATQNGWAPMATDNGRADFLDYSRGVETCYFCHK